MIERVAEGRTDLVFDFVGAANPATTQDSQGTSLIQWCAYYGDVSAIKFLVSKGEVLRALGDNLGLDAAAFHGHWRLCEFLLENGADADSPLPDTGETPLHAALSSTRRAQRLVVKVLLAHGADWKVVSFDRETKMPKLSAASSVSPIARGGFTAFLLFLNFLTIWAFVSGINNNNFF